MQYSIAIPKGKAVTKPTIMVLKRAPGTAVEALEHSSARWMAPSMPAQRKFGLAIPDKKTTASDPQPLSLIKLVQTNSAELKVPDRDRHVTKMMTKEQRENTTGEFVSQDWRMALGRRMVPYSPHHESNWSV